MNMRVIAAVAACGFALSGCATIIKGTTQSISVNTGDVTGAQCTLINSQGTWFLTTPGSVVVHKTKTDIDATCKKDGYEAAKTVIPSSFNGVTAGNILAGGLIGIGVDAASGANFNYPDDTTIPMVPVSPMAAAPAPATAPAKTGTPSS